jgi:hypothetical protein
MPTIGGIPQTNLNLLFFIFHTITDGILTQDIITSKIYLQDDIEHKLNMIKKYEKKLNINPINFSVIFTRFFT